MPTRSARPGSIWPSLPPAEAGAKIRSRPPSVALALAAALDDWAAIRRRRRSDCGRGGATERSRPRRRPRPLADRAADRPGSIRQGGPAGRTASTGKDGQVRRAGRDQPALAGDRSGRCRRQCHGRIGACGSAQQRHPRDVWVNYALGTVLERLSRRDEAIRFYTAARSIRPETAHELAPCPREARRFRRGHRRVPRSQAAAAGQCQASRTSWAGSLKDKKGLSREADEMLEAAVAAGREAIRLKPD